MINIIVAYERDRGIGYRGSIPWYFAEDLIHFKRTTIGCPIVMGRKTWESLPIKPLPKRINVILTTNPDCDEYLGTMPVIDIYEALHTIVSYCGYKRPIYVIGGASVYKQFLEKDLVDSVIATEIKGSYKCDVFFPTLPGEWTESTIYEGKDFNIVQYDKALNKNG